MDTPETLQEKLDLKSLPTPLNGESENTATEGGLLKMLEGAFLTPMLSLLTIYLSNSNGKRKTVENCIMDFRHAHRNWLMVFFAIDFFFRLLYLVVVFVVVIRGLAVDSYIKSILVNRQPSAESCVNNLIICK